MNKSMKAMTAFTVVASLSANDIKPAHAIEPMTVAAIATLASTVIAAGGKKSAVPMKIAMAQLKTTMAVHDRLDTIEASLGAILLNLADLPKEIRDIMEEDSDTDRSETVMGIANTLYEQIDVSIKDRKDPARDDMIRYNIVNLQNERSALFRRSDMIIPTIVQAFVTEVAAAQATKKSKAAFENIYAQYDARLKQAQSIDPKHPGSLMWTLNHLMQEQAVHEQALIKEFPGQTVPFKQNVYPWFKHTLVNARAYTKEEDCWTYSGEETKQRRVLTTCYIPSTAYDFVHTTLRERAVAVFNSPMDMSLYRLSITAKEPVVVTDPAVRFAEHQNDVKFEAPYLQTETALEAQVNIFNARVSAIEEIMLALRLVDLTRGIIQKGIDADPQILQTELKNWAEPLGQDMISIEDQNRKAGAAWLVSQMDAGRLKARSDISDALAEIQQAMDDDKKEKWRGDVIAILNIVAASAQFAQALESEAAIARMKAASSVIASIPEGEEPKPAVKTKQPQKADISPVVAGQSETKSIIELPQNNAPVTKPLDQMTALDKINYAMSIKKELLETRLETNTGTINKARMSRALEGLVVLDSMSPTTGDKYFQENYKSTQEQIGEVLKDGFGSLSITEGLKSLALASIRPDVVADGSLTSVSVQLELRDFINADIAKQLKAVMGDSNLDRLDLSYKNALQCQNGCFRAVPVPAKP